MALRPITLARLAARLLRIRLGWLLREGSSLALTLAAQILDNCNETRDLRLQLSVRRFKLSNAALTLGQAPLEFVVLAEKVVICRHQLHDAVIISRSALSALKGGANQVRRRCRSADP